ncbi:MAG: hypothetical protein AAB870_02230 [Patescibacteria group bacterium]
MSLFEKFGIFSAVDFLSVIIIAGITKITGLEESDLSNKETVKSSIKEDFEEITAHYFQEVLNDVEGAEKEINALLEVAKKLNLSKEDVYPYYLNILFGHCLIVAEEHEEYVEDEKMGVLTLKRVLGTGFTTEAKRWICDEDYYAAMVESFQVYHTDNGIEHYRYGDHPLSGGDYHEDDSEMEFPHPKQVLEVLLFVFPELQKDPDVTNVITKYWELYDEPLNIRSIDS